MLKLLTFLHILSLSLFLLQPSSPFCNGFPDSVVESGELHGGGVVGGGLYEEEAEMESEISRRLMLMQRKYISYATLKRDMVPCDNPGASYYDCHPRAANTYNRGCEVIARCRGFWDGFAEYGLQFPGFVFPSAGL
ncbi:unnamed protein product [Linum tenue]|uniref:Rapid ALkalinization Factor n=1 Tax=Linum tenue TaxID=586396 RepID=A0AAV0GZH5_9ROSI|nr:unnamed protein product [Linum tenue]